MAKKFLLAIFLCSASMVSSCSLYKRREIVAKPDPNGSVKERIAYHKSEIRKYELAMETEKHQSMRALQNRDMSEVRRSNNKMARYQRKIDAHKAAIATLETKEN
ncbi:hypothetical protein K0U07_04425 [bacterium]|nr:hypothetical protein [bacterium]